MMKLRTDADKTGAVIVEKGFKKFFHTLEKVIEQNRIKKQLSESHSSKHVAIGEVNLLKFRAAAQAVFFSPIR